MVDRGRSGRVSPICDLLVENLVVSEYRRLILSSFAFAYDEEVEPGLVAFIRLLVFDFEWSRAQKKGKLPTTMLDKKVGEVLERIISDREAGYGQTLQVSHVFIGIYQGIPKSS